MLLCFDRTSQCRNNDGSNTGRPESPPNTQHRTERAGSPSHAGQIVNAANRSTTATQNTETHLWRLLRAVTTTVEGLEFGFVEALFHMPGLETSERLLLVTESPKIGN